MGPNISDFVCISSIPLLLEHSKLDILTWWTVFMYIEGYSCKIVFYNIG